MTQYAPVDIVFIDGVDVSANVELAKICWEENPDVVVTRGAMETPEQEVPEQGHSFALGSLYYNGRTMAVQAKQRDLQEWGYRAHKEPSLRFGVREATCCSILVRMQKEDSGYSKRFLLNELGLLVFYK